MPAAAATIRVEFYGIARTRAGVDAVTVPLAKGSLQLGELLRLLSTDYPQLARDCFAVENGACLQRGYIANIDGGRFVNDAHAVLHAGSTVLILSADAGG